MFGGDHGGCGSGFGLRLGSQSFGFSAESFTAQPREQELSTISKQGRAWKDSARRVGQGDASGMGYVGWRVRVREEGFRV